MTATNYDGHSHDGHNHDGHKVHHDGHNNENVKSNGVLLRNHQIHGHTIFRKHGCGRHGHCGRHGLWPSWFVAVIVEPRQVSTSTTEDKNRPLKASRALYSSICSQFLH